MNTETFTTLNRVALRNGGIFVPVNRETLLNDEYVCTDSMVLTARALSDAGYWLTEEAFHALGSLTAQQLQQLVECINHALGTHLNWRPLIKGWDKDRIPRITQFEFDRNTHLLNRIPDSAIQYVTLPCGHRIPDGTFDLERYTGCPYCGTPFETTPGIVLHGQGSRMRSLALFTLPDMEQMYRDLLESPAPLDATRADSLKLLLSVLPIPDSISIAMKETLVMVADYLLTQDRDIEATYLFSTPTDILRYLWYKKTGRLVIIKPRLLEKKAFNWRSILPDGPYHLPKRNLAKKMKEHLRLRFSRRECHLVALWLNNMPLSARAMAENMHPLREMWVRFIRALRLTEYARRPGFEHLKVLLDVFYRSDYNVWAGQLDLARRTGDRDRVFAMLSQRPELFSRNLFSTMLRFGPEEAIHAFSAAATDLKPTLLLSLANAADPYFSRLRSRYARPVTGGRINIPHNPLLNKYTPPQCVSMAQAVTLMFHNLLRLHFIQNADADSEGRTIYIAPELYGIPLDIGDRALTIQDASTAFQGERFKVEGNKVRIFLTWGEGLPAQHLDLDLSAHIFYINRGPGFCNYQRLTLPGAIHSGDIRSIPDQVGTAEYIDLDLSQLYDNSATYVIFYGNAYTPGAIDANARLGWMSSRYPMKVSETTGVAYDPSCVQHMVRIPDAFLSKGLAFGVLDIPKREITWLELPNDKQASFLTNSSAVIDYLSHLRHKTSVGEVLEIKADAQHITLVYNPANADFVYDRTWAHSPGALKTLLQ